MVVEIPRREAPGHAHRLKMRPAPSTRPIAIAIRDRLRSRRDVEAAHHVFALSTFRALPIPAARSGARARWAVGDAMQLAVRQTRGRRAARRAFCKHVAELLVGQCEWRDRQSGAGGVADAYHV